MRPIRVLLALVVAVGVLAGSATVAGAHAETWQDESTDVLVLGDSLCVGAQTVGGLQALLDRARIRADLRCTSGVPLATGLAVVREMPRVPPVVIVELGTNHTRTIEAFRSEAQTLVGELRARGALAIRWLTAGTTTPGRYDDQNAAIRSLPGVTVADWAAVLAFDPSLFAADGIHYTRAGAVRFAEYLLDQAIGGTGDATVEGMRQQVRRLYLATFLREPDAEGHWYWTVARWYGVRLTLIAEHFVRSPEFEARYGDASPEVLVDLIYRNVLRRAADVPGATYWTARLAAGLRAGELLVGFSESEEHRLATLPEAPS